MKVGSDVLEGSPGTSGKLQIQPYLVCVGDATNGGDFFVIINKKMVAVGTSFLRAFDVLFKSHFVFNVHYAPQLNLFYNFFESFIYAINETKPKVSVAALEVSLSKF